MYSILSEGTEFPSGVSDKALAVASLVILGVISAALTAVGMFWRMATQPEPTILVRKYSQLPNTVDRGGSSLTNQSRPTLRLKSQDYLEREEPHKHEVPATCMCQYANPNRLKPPSLSPGAHHQHLNSSPAQNSASLNTGNHGGIVVIPSKSTSV